MAGSRRNPAPQAGDIGRAAICGAALWLVFLAGCASQVAPSGGPEDKEPPGIVTTTPAPGGLNVREPKIAVEFSEYVDRRSFQESTFLSPSAGQLQYDWSGTSVEITAPETLRGNTTYILTIGTDLKDTKGNRMDQSYTLPFSTGPVIDSCSVGGLVDDPEPDGVMIFAFDVTGGRGDTLDPAAVKPDYLTQAGKGGTFLLRNMREGEYRLMAVRDVFKNLVYDIQTDRYGMASSDVRLDSVVRAIEGVGFRLTVDDTVRPFLSSAKAKNADMVALRFNEAVTVPGGIASLSIADTLTGAALEARGVFRADTTGKEYVVVTARQDSGTVYRLTISAFSDVKGNVADSAGRSAVFEAGTGRDSLPPALTLNISRDSLTGFLPLDTVRLTFSEAVDTGAFVAGFALDGAAGAAVPGGLRWSGPNSARFVPAQPYPPGAWYAVKVRLDSIKGPTGVRGPDSLLFRRFRIAEEKMLTGISGRVPVGDSVRVPADAGRLVVEARNLSATAQGGIRVSADASGGFRIEPLPEGLYVLSAFLDRNGNGLHDCGVPHPVVFAEPFGIYPDTVRLRPRWPVEGVRIVVGR